ncbi:mycothiol synthase [Mobilicoccus caccae]|uniref:Mycothiol acetyltransferase n=1 Tax=Mobilicoccus caccae TaxID=1859295 RepID=A0ABQ6IU76_9MICO|nr:mycothiol synthase [Mobilicoccus caccae]GMA41001.1 mycothiol acetyltransferase [Mobilicoccus caccae]
MDPRIVETLAPEVAAAVRAAAEDVRRHDGVAALSEQTLLHLDAPAGEHRHVLAVDGDQLVGYAHLDHTGVEPGVEILVVPSHRRRGVATSLWSRVTSLAPTARVWAHGDLAEARGWAGATGLVVVRELLQMARPLAGLADVGVDLPPGYGVRTFTPADIDAWVRINGRAFADHPEQGRVTADDVRARMREDWFDPEGFFLVDGPDSLAAFHWTKTADGEGEVYVVGVDPDQQGKGLGKAATLLGLRHLARRGLPRVTLYVDGDNTAALATYERLGFERSAIDVMYGS